MLRGGKETFFAFGLCWSKAIRYRVVQERAETAGYGCGGNN